MNGLLKEESGAAVSGNILLKGQDIAKMEPEELRRRVGLVFQTPSPFPFSIYKNMTYALRYYGVKDKKELDRQVKEKLQKMCIRDRDRPVLRSILPLPFPRQGPVSHSHKERYGQSFDIPRPF